MDRLIAPQPAKMCYILCFSHMGNPDRSEITCPRCHARSTYVVDSRGVPEHDLIRRRRRCTSCGLRFNTHETVETPFWRLLEKTVKAAKKL